MTNGINFPIDGGPTMSGKWTNPKNGDSFVVEDNFFQDGEFLIKTTDGRLLDYNFIQDYVQAKDGDVPVQRTPEPTPRPEIYRPEPNNIFSPKPVNVDTEIINRILGDVDLPVKITLDWTKIPKDKLTMLTDTLNVPQESITDWLINKIDIYAIRDNIIKQIEEDVTGKPEVKPEPKPAPKTKKKK